MTLYISAPWTFFLDIQPWFVWRDPRARIAPFFSFRNVEAFQIPFRTLESVTDGEGTGLGLGPISLWGLIANELLPGVTWAFHVIAIATIPAPPCLKTPTSSYPPLPSISLKRSHTCLHLIFPLLTFSFSLFLFTSSFPLSLLFSCELSDSVPFFFFYKVWSAFNVTKVSSSPAVKTNIYCPHM